MPKREMLINYVPGEECRVAVVEDGRLDEVHAERMDAVSHVGNIYVGRVVNVEPGIQAAFVDFGLEQSGFLHVSDLHPRYFPGDDGDATERVGMKTPRRERPPIQQCLKRGQEIAVQVLKEGVGTKGPTVTSYLSIPGRFLVMMPQMDKVGVSRKVEDDETRRKMREILDQLELPEGFGFILRTAGLERTKAELKRDLAYLLRLWKDMERRWAKGKRPRLLYSESDLLVRALRDMLTTDIERIVIDDDSALQRAARFLKIVAPRSATNLMRYAGGAPLFHAAGVEHQIQMIHAREVPLPSGGALVFDETEALVAIDVNSGRMRNARDAETTAYRTNLEAADEICRQLRLRDVGGVIVNDLIDMRSAKHRREIEQRFRENLKKDRARTTVLAISNFGILEMTRQRMRGSHESVHFATCPVCRGRGLVQKPDSVAADAMRELATLLETEKVARVEMVVHPRIAGELLSSKRRGLNKLERRTGKRVDVRISEAVPVDRVTFYAYDERGSDLDISRLPKARLDEKYLVSFDGAVKATDDWAIDPEREAEAAETDDAEEAEAEQSTDQLDTIEAAMTASGDDEDDGSGEPRDGKGKRRRRRRRKSARAEQDQPSPSSNGSPVKSAEQSEPKDDGTGDEGESAQTTRKKRRRRRRRRGGAEQGSESEPAEKRDEAKSGEQTEEPAPDEQPEDGQAKKSKKRRRRGGRRRPGAEAQGGEQTADGAADRAGAKPGRPAGASGASAEKPDKQSAGGAAGDESGGDDGKPAAGKKTRRKTSRRSTKKGAQADGGAKPASKPEQGQKPKPAAPKPRSLYASRRKLSPSELAKIKPEE